jgi:hypothetical protein
MIKDKYSGKVISYEILLTNKQWADMNSIIHELSYMELGYLKNCLYFLTNGEDKHKTMKVPKSLIPYIEEYIILFKEEIERR